MTTRADLLRHPGIEPDDVDDIIEIAARLQEADREADPARRAKGEAHARPEDLDIAPHFVDEAIGRLARRRHEHAARVVQAKAPPRHKGTAVAVLLFTAAAVLFLGWLLRARSAIDHARLEAWRAEVHLEAELQQQVDRSAAVLALIETPDLRALAEAAAAPSDVPDRVLAVEQMGDAMIEALRRAPLPRTEAGADLQHQLLAELGESRARIHAAARRWRDAHSEWTQATETTAGRITVAVGLAAPPDAE
jgi:hypothetical protein